MARRTRAGDPGSTLTAKTVSGLQWTYLSATSNAGSQLLYTAIMARLLSPAAFGLMAMATLAVNFGQYFTRMGVGQALVQKPEVTDDDVRASWTTSLLLGGVCCATVWMTAPAIAGLFNEPNVTPLLRALAVTFVFLGGQITSQSLLRRQLRFRELAMIQIFGSISGAVVGVSMALAGAGVWSLVAASIWQSALGVVLHYWRARHPLRPLFKWGPFKALYSFGARISLLRLIEFLSTNLDTFAVGRFLSAALLGQYNRAFHLVNLPLSKYLSLSLSSVLFPSLSTIQTDHVRLRRAYLAVISLGGLLLFPIAIGMSAAAEGLVLVVLGDQWERAVSLIHYFAIAAALNILSRMSHLVCEAIAELNKALILQSSYIVLLGSMLFMVRNQDVWAFAAVLAIGEIIRHVAYLALMTRLLDLKATHLWHAYAPALFSAVIVGVALLLGRRLLTVQDLSPLVLLIAQIGLAAIALAISIRINPMSSIRQQLRTRLAAAGILSDRRPHFVRLSRLILG